MSLSLSERLRVIDDLSAQIILSDPASNNILNMSSEEVLRLIRTRINLIVDRWWRIAQLKTVLSEIGFSAPDEVREAIGHISDRATELLQWLSQDPRNIRSSDPVIAELDGLVAWLEKIREFAQ